MNSAIQKKLELLLTWDDKDFQRGRKRFQAGMAAVKKTVLSIVKAAALVAAAFAAAGIALLKFIEKGAQAKSVEESFLGFARASGMAKDTIIDLREAVRDTIDDTTLMQQSVMALSGGLDPKRLIQYWEMAKQIGDVSSRSTVEVFTALTLAINKAQPRTLEQIGITIRLGEATQAYLEKTGKVAKELTSQDRTMAISQALLQKYTKDFYSVGDVTTRVREKFQQFQTTVENLKSRFFELIAGSPAAQEYLGILTERVQGLMDSLDEEKINRFVQKFVNIFDRMDGYIDRLGEMRSQVEEFLVTYEAPLKGLGAGIVTSQVLGAIAPIAVALGLSSPLAAGIIAITSLFAGLGFMAVEAFKNMQDEIDETARILAEEYPLGGMNPQDYEKQIKMLETIQEKKEEIDEEPRTPGGLTPRLIQWEEEVGAQRIGPDRFELMAAAQAEANARELETQEAHTAALIDLDEYRAQRAMEIGSAEHARAVRDFAIRQEAVRQGFWAMDEYQTLFFRHGAHMGRALNAMLMRGFTEAIASYIEMKTEEARIQAVMFAAYAIGALASGQFGKAAAYGAAAAKMALVSGAAMVAAGYVRSYGQEKAEGMTAEGRDERFEAADFGEEDFDSSKTRRSASGVINGRPVIINILSKVEIKSGVTVFGDSEDGLEEFYGEHIRDYIQDDIETGIISIPA